MMYAKARRLAAGHTLLEMAVVITISGILAGVAAPPLVTATQARHRAVWRQTLLAEARTAMERMTRELREAARDPDREAPDLALADQEHIAFGATGYRLEGNVLQRRSAGDGAWRTLARHAAQFALTYRDEDGATLAAVPLSAADRARVRRIGLSLTLENGAERIALVTGVYLRRFAFGSI